MSVISAVAIIIIVNIWGKHQFRKNSSKTLEYSATLKTQEFIASLDEQLTLVRQMVKMPSIIKYLETPNNENVRELALNELHTFQNAFLSKSIFWVSDSNLEFWQDMEFKYDVNPDDPDSYWYKMTMYETEEYNFNINYNPDLNVTMLWVNAVIRNSFGTPVGIAGTGIPLSDFINTMLSGIDEEITIYLYNDDLVITGAKDQSLLTEDVNLLTKMPDLKKTDSVPTRITSYAAPNNQYVLAPMELLNWHMVMQLPYNIKEAVVNSATPLAICLVIIIIAVMAFVAVNLSMSIHTLTVAVDDLSSGNADLTQRVVLKSRSTFKAIENLVESLNKFIIKLQSIVANVKDSNATLVTTGNNLEDSTQDTTASIEQIIQIIRSMSNNINTQANSVDKTSNAVNEISTNINNLNTMIESQSDNIAQASTAVKQMISNINTVDSSVERLAQAFRELEEKSVRGVAKQEEVNNQIQQIKVQSESLKDANQVISSIAGQTNLLAMNAAIEAAHAGEAGKGFSVVADEIRKLSENSSSQSKEVSAKLKAIQDSVTQIVAVSQESQMVLTAVSDDIKSTNALVQEINGAMQEQKNDSEQIDRSLQILNTNSAEVKSSSEEMTVSNKSILSEIENLENATSSMKQGMDEMLTGAQKINETGSRLSTLSKDMDVSIKNIGLQLDQFKV